VALPLARIHPGMSVVPRLAYTTIRRRSTLAPRGAATR
jgi:hypothetical protein